MLDEVRKKLLGEMAEIEPKIEYEAKGNVIHGEPIKNDKGEITYPYKYTGYKYTFKIGDFVK